MHMKGKTWKWTALTLTGLGAVVALQTTRRRARRLDFKNQVVLITGGSRGLGLVMARQLAAEGARLALLARDEQELAQARQHLAEYGPELLVFPCDIKDQTQATEAIERVVNRFGRVDVLINNAGVIQVGPLAHMQVDDFANALAVHFWGPLYLMMAAIPHMQQQGSGRIINISSVGGKVAVPHLLPYSASKFALTGLSDGLRAELAKDNIRVTTINPGLMRTGSHVHALIKGQHQREFAWFAILGAMPFISTTAENAAAQIIEACRYGDAQRVITLPARLLVALNHLFPETMAEAMKFTNYLLPEAVAGAGDALKRGGESQSNLAPSILTRLSDAAAKENNELHLSPTYSPPDIGNGRNGL